MRILEDLTGCKFGRLQVLEQAGTDKNSHTMWRCKCDCGKETKVSSWNLKKGISKSCGCYRKERLKDPEGNARFLARGIEKHGDAKGGHPTRLYRVWQSMKTRCKNPNSDSYRHYGGNGVTICKEWETYSNFKEWAVSSGYDECAKYGQCTLDRVDPYGGYCPDNCRWVDMKTQQNNKRSTQKC